MSFTEIAATIGKILKEQTDGMSQKPQRVLVPAKFQAPTPHHSGVSKSCPTA